MKKVIFLTLSFFLMNISCFGQESGIVSYTVTHDWTKKYLSCEYLSKAERERSAYVWGAGRDNGWEVKAELKFNAGVSCYERKVDENSQWRKGDDFIIHRNHENGETFDVLTLLDKQYLIQDSMVCQHWKIKNDMKEVAGRICMNASYYDSVKGKEVIAWFALDLPIPIGPDRYCGLPGMILEINEANGALVYTATSIIFSDDNMEIAKPTVKKKRKVIDTQEYIRIIAKYIEECKKMQRPYFWGIAF